MRFITSALVFLVLAAIEVSSTSLERNCGVPASPRRFRRIVGGRVANRLSSPWMALALGNYTRFCAGTLINSQFVLTSGVCVHTVQPKKVVLGVHDRNCTTENCLSEQMEVNIHRIAYHQLDDNSSPVSDIALLQLENYVHFTDYIRPICLFPPPEKREEKLKDFIATGWGNTRSGHLSSVLMTTSLQRLKRRTCESYFNQFVDSQLCAGSKNHDRDSCSGDSGGPLSAQLNHGGKKRFFQIGIVSLGTSTCNGIGVYTKVSYFKDWILQTVNGAHSN